MYLRLLKPDEVRDNNLTTENNFKIGESLMMGGILEIFSGKAYAKGDANRDDIVNLKDLVLLAQYVAGWGVTLY